MPAAMTASSFFRYELRTTDVDGARAFYSDVLGADAWGPALGVSALPAAAVARGAPPHWLGHIHVGDVDGAVRAITAAGGEQRGPLLREGSVARAALRDPFGAIIAVSSETPAPHRSRVGYHLLHSRDLEATFTFYATQFGWVSRGASDLGPERGEHRWFAWDAAAPIAGSIANTARLPHVHVHWMYFFEVADLDAALDTVRARGGKALPTLQMDDGARFAACEDTHAAAFGLMASAAGR